MVTANYSYSERVGARAELASALLEERHAARIAAAGLKRSDLEEVRDHGNAARAADTEQAGQLASLKQARADKAVSADDVLAREDNLKRLLPAVILDLKASQPEEAAWLSAISVARYRIRSGDVTAAAEGASETATADAKKVERVAREDKIARLSGAAKIVKLLLDRSATHIVTELSERGVSREALTALHADADAMERAGKNVQLSAEATRREASAVEAQSKRWNAIRRMVSEACAGDAELTRRLQAT
jgi:hypothetical protein